MNTRVRKSAAALLGGLLLASWPMFSEAAEARGQVVRDLPATDRAIEPAVEDVFEVGSIAGAAWETFGEEVRVAFDREGNLFLFDTDNARIVVVDRQGRLVREFGQAGGGPGEFRMPMGFTVTPGGEVVVSDVGQQALLIFSTEGEFLRSVPLDLEKGVPGAGFVADPSGGAILSPPGGIRISMRGPGGDTDSGSSLLIQRYGLLEEGEPETLYAAWEPPPPSEGEGGTIEMDGGRSIQLSNMAKLRGFEPEVLFGVTPDGSLVVSDSVAYRVKLLSPDGTPRILLQRPIEPREVTASVREAERQRRLDELDEGEGPRVRMITSGGGGSGMSSSGSGGMTEMLRGRIEDMEFMDEIPVLTDLGVDHTGRIWAQRSGSEVGEDGPIDVLSPTGEYLGTVAAGSMDIPSAFGPDGLVAEVRRDELDVVTVVVRRILF
jgi:hypothetical protein